MLPLQCLAIHMVTWLRSTCPIQTFLFTPELINITDIHSAASGTGRITPGQSAWVFVASRDARGHSVSPGIIRVALANGGLEDYEKNILPLFYTDIHVFWPWNSRKSDTGALIRKYSYPWMWKFEKAPCQIEYYRCESGANIIMTPCQTSILPLYQQASKH